MGRIALSSASCAITAELCPGSLAGLKDVWDPALHPNLIISVLGSELRPQTRFIGENAAVEPDGMDNEQDEREPGPKG